MFLLSPLTPAQILYLTRANCLGRTGHLTGFSTREYHLNIRSFFQLLLLGQMIDLSPTLFLHPEASASLLPSLRRQQGFSCNLRPRHSESFSAFTCQCCGKKLRFNLKLILQPLCIEMDVKSELITTEASTIENLPRVPPKRG